MSSGHFRFGLFEFDPETLELRREGVPVHLQAQPGQVLKCLARNAGRIVSREELRRVVWGDQTFVDFERGLNFCMSQVRAALGDDAARPTYIRTIAKHGYQFIAPAQWIAAPEISTTRLEPARTHGRRAWLLILAALLLAVVGVAIYLVRLHTTPKDLPIVAVVRFDNETGDPGMNRFSDGLTDNFVERLTSLGDGHYKVIGNAQILRGPREERDLNVIASQLRANFVVLGQIQAYQDRTRVLVHLIHMPEQTHVSVGRVEQQMTDPLQLEAQAAQQIATKFFQRLAVGSSASPPAVSH